MLHTRVSDAPMLIARSVLPEEGFERPDEPLTIAAGLDDVKKAEASPVPVVLEKVKFRRACFEVSDAEEFRAGLACGQATLVGKQQELTDEYLFALFDDLLRDLEISKPRLVGCVIGMVDALLLCRKMLPPEFRALLRSLK